MRYLLDTNVVSALRVRGRNPVVEAWSASVPLADQFVSAFSIAEIERGVIAKERVDAEQGIVLRRWFEEHVLPAFAGRVLGFDLATARILAAYRVPEHAPLDDALIASVAEAGGLTVVTRNERHFEPLGVSCLNPWEPPEPPSA
ncbi:type II toxin-antitoxin system VapC family toxin [Nocardioides marinquilinus]|uniref:Type II toxin-antitoxin system VapC family toxin n=1 Tax=Nocardioides marinquilinus TaxID=1210400 RepID=A0ABP9PQ67_9ACTN